MSERDTGAATPLDPLALPLWGSRLIEASAGTGKTWTIAALYLRLVLGHGVPATAGDDLFAPGDRGTAFPQPLVPAQILVMTFTRAATRELSNRIRDRLVSAAHAFRADAVPDDPLLVRLLADYPEPAQREAAAWRLATAAQAMDDAAVLTIDAWCQRMLVEHAFDSGAPFDETLQPDESALRAEAARDWWREAVYPLEGEALSLVLATWPTIDALVEDMAALLPHTPPASADDDATLAQVLGPLLAELSTLKQGWPAKVQAMREWLLPRLELKTDSGFDKKQVQARWAAPWLDDLDAWAANPWQVRWTDNEKAHERLPGHGLRRALKPPPALELPAVFDDLSELSDHLDTLPDPRHALRAHAARHVARRLQALKARAGLFGFADLLTRLDAALAGPNGARLRDRIVRQFPVVMVDEFQDTSPLQYRVFDRLYDIAANDPATALFLIGDPKQSIYAFRGADIRSYLRARRATVGRHAVLGTNHRSTAALVGAVNALFEQAEARPGRGAFHYRAPPDLADAGRATPVVDELPFHAVAARGRDDVLRDASGDVPAMTIVVDPALRAGREVQRRFAARCAEDLVRRLNDPASAFVPREPASVPVPGQGPAPGSPGVRPLRPSDIAVLVRTGAEAEAVRRALRLRGVASVYLSDNDSVFRTPEAADLLRWLRAVADPLDARLARAAFATATVGLPLDALATLGRDDVAFEARVDQLRQLNATWRRQGVLPMLRQSLHLLGLPARWLAEPDGERRLTNLLHLAELLQAGAADAEGEHALVRWFAEQASGRGPISDDKLVRLESDADLVQVVTGHKSKGLEYPVVYLPFAGGFRSARLDRRRGFAAVADAASPSGRRIAFEVPASLTRDLEDERLQEDLRWLYVALTRARHALWIGVAATADMRARPPRCIVHESAFGALLTGGQPLEAATLPAAVATALAGAPGVRVVEATPDEDPLRAPPTMRQQAGTEPPLVDRGPYAGRFERRWSIGSFSALVRDLGHDPPPRLLPDARREAQWQELVSEDEVDADEGADGARPAAAASGPAALAASEHRFPRGAVPGNFLHAQLEWLAAQDTSLAGDADLRARLARRCERAGWGRHADDVVDWLTRLVATPLPPLGRALQDLATQQPEMEFWLPGEGGRATRVDALCRAHLLPGRPRPALPERALRGMLMGFADLVFEHDGRYWVLDYKSNALGSRSADYHADALATAMAAHRYDVQGAIYLLALHRLLRTRLGEAYAPERHLGGALLLFLRGIGGPQAGCVHLAPPAAFLDAMDAELAGGGPGAEGGSEVGVVVGIDVEGGRDTDR